MCVTVIILVDKHSDTIATFQDSPLLKTADVRTRAQDSAVVVFSTATTRTRTHHVYKPRTRWQRLCDDVIR